MKPLQYLNNFTISLRLSDASYKKKKKLPFKTTEYLNSKYYRNTIILFIS